MINTTDITLTDLITQATQHLDELNYSKGTKQQYTLKWGHLQNYAKSKNYTTFSQELGDNFLRSKYGIKKGIKLKTSQVSAVRTIKVLYEYMHNNNFQKCHQLQGKKTPPQFLKVLEEYKFMQVEMQLSSKTIQNKSTKLINFFLFISNQGINIITELTANNVLSYINTLSTNSQATKSGILFTLRDFLAFLYSRGYLMEPLNKLFPVIFSNKLERIPSYYSMPQTVNIIKSYMADNNLLKDLSINSPLLFNKNKEKLTRAGISYILNKYVELARRKHPDLFPAKVTPRVLRRSKAMHLLEGNVNLIYIRDFLGHASVITTEIYAKSNPEVKRKAIESASPSLLLDDKFSKETKQELLDWLKDNNLRFIM